MADLSVILEHVRQKRNNESKGKRVMQHANGINEAVEKYMVAANAKLVNYYETHFPNNPREVLTVEFGNRYARVWRVSPAEAERGSRGSCHAFIDLTNGDILKPASWKAPAKHARGNVFAENFGGGIGGQFAQPNYLT